MKNMKHSVVTSYQTWARRGYLTPLKCFDKEHPPLVADPESADLFVKCFFCDFRREIGVYEYNRLERSVALAKKLHDNQ